jgi:hypothetical protein
MQVVAPRDSDEKFDWSKTWVQEMFLSADEKRRRKAEIEQQQGITPEVKRYKEIKAGVIVSSVGIALSIVLFVLMGGIITGNSVSHDAAQILSRLWIAGVIPVFVGFALITNGVIVSKKMAEAALRASQGARQDSLEAATKAPQLRSDDTNEFHPSPFSVTEQTTKHLGEK